jgi:hypothetical protein
MQMSEALAVLFSSVFEEQLSQESVRDAVCEGTGEGEDEDEEEGVVMEEEKCDGEWSGIVSS